MNGRPSTECLGVTIISAIVLLSALVITPAVSFYDSIHRDAVRRNVGFFQGHGYEEQLDFALREIDALRQRIEVLEAGQIEMLAAGIFGTQDAEDR